MFFENSLAPGSYPYSAGTVSAPSTLKLVDDKLPVETSEFVSGPNALELSWRSESNGGWDAQVNMYRWRNREVGWSGDTLFLWLWSERAIAAQDLPRIALIDLDEGHTAPMPLAAFTTGLKAKHWTRVAVPLRQFKSASLNPFAASRLSGIVFAQNAPDGKPHTLYMDDIRIGKPLPPPSTDPSRPQPSRCAAMSVTSISTGRVLTTQPSPST